MNIDWQTVIAVGLVVAAAGYLAYSGWKVIARKRAGGCGTCSSCPSSTDGKRDDQRPFVSIEQLTTNRETESFTSSRDN